VQDFPGSWGKSVENFALEIIAVSGNIL